MNAFVVSAALLGLLVAGGVAVIAAIRARMRSVDDRATWERTLADCRNLRDQGVLNEEEYRNIRTLVEPRLRGGGPAADGRHQPPIDAAGSENGRD